LFRLLFLSIILGWCYSPDGPGNNCNLAIHRTGTRTWRT